MVLKTFNLSEETYKKFSKICKENGISMSKQIEFFIRSQVEEEPEVRHEYLRKLRRIDAQKGIPFRNINELRKLIEE